MALDLSLLLPSFPVREHCLYLDHAAVCPLPGPVADAMRRRIDDQELAGHSRNDRWRDTVLTCRHLGAELMGCSPQDVSLIRSTSEGLSVIAEGLDWRAGDEVLVGNEEFAANVAPWLNLATRGVTIRRYRQHDGRIDLDEVEQQLTEKTRLVTVSWVAFHSGWIAPLAGLAGLCRDRGIRLVVDAIQGLGVIPMNMTLLGIDAVVADSHKWMLGPEGAGLMATSEAFRAELRPVLTGWRNIRRHGASFFLDELETLPSGRRFEPGANNVVGLAGLAAALDLLTSTGTSEICERVEMLNRHLTRMLLGRGWEVFSPGSGHPVAGIVSARPPAGATPEDVRSRLAERHVVCSVRQDRLRLSPHFYTTRGELEALDTILGKCGV